MQVNRIFNGGLTTKAAWEALTEVQPDLKPYAEKTHYGYKQGLDIARLSIEAALNEVQKSGA
jgi:hypothetical protein